MTNLSLRAFAAAGALTIGFGVSALAQPSQAAASSTRVDRLEQIQIYRTKTWHWQALMRRPKTPTQFSERRADSLAYITWVRNLWLRRARAAQRRAENPPHRAGWVCIQRHERHPAQGWRTHTGNGYYGGLQMDIHFQRTYGSDLLRRKGTANRWSPIEQMWVAERAYQSGRGFYPWPNTARSCGLI
jgi:hypothetical protein